MRRHYLTDLALVHRNSQWLRANFPLRHKLVYYPAMVAAYFRLALGRDRQVQYMGRPFVFDNTATPLNLQTYPFEVTHKIRRHMAAPPMHVLDIGANIGQFAVTMAAICPNASIDAFEPNRVVFPLLEANTADLSRVRAFSVGVGVPGPARLFFEPGRSAIGSLFAANAGDAGRLREIPITLTDDVPFLTGRRHYDLIVVDVEGVEMDVIANLRGVSSSYLFIEVSGPGRYKPYTDADLLESIRTVLGPFEAVWQSTRDRTGQSFEMLLAFEPHPGR